jgi:ubiquinone/menaquinone biosynthesis C-methylase UbiE
LDCDKNNRYELLLNRRYADDLKKGKVERSNIELNRRFIELIGGLKSGSQVLEIGCGAGSMTAFLADMGCDVIGTDVSEVLLEYAKKEHKNCRFMKMYGEKLEFPSDFFDAIVSFDLLEHIGKVNKHIEEVYRVLKRGGRYIFGTPNRWTNLPYCIIRDKSLTKWKEYHPSLQTKRSLRKLLNSNAFKFKIYNLKTNRFIAEKLIFPLNRINFERIPIQTNFYVVACKQ